ncbi:hypothetical protein BDZ89DRAFT_1058168 [Hymenopellis radicata]|nr:hypothetical protein BDZ89DRAFT_1058168 [Hymenopellis radicata]
MFNSPRPAQRYGGSTSANGFGGSFVDENPLSSSVYDGLDPWSAAPSPSPTPMPPASTTFSSVIADATLPSIYNAAFAAVDPANTGETSVGSLSRVLATASLPASTIDRIVSIVSSKPRVSRTEFFVALALVALAQDGKDVSVEQVAALSSQNTLPEPKLDLSNLQPSQSTFSPPFKQNNSSIVRAPLPTYASDDPWNTSRMVGGPSNLGGFEAPGPVRNGAPSALAGSGLPSEWWKRQDSVSVTILGQQGFILNRYTVYQVKTELGSPVTRRYSEFVFLWDVLTRRYPFRLFPALPPKRLTRCLNFIRNHPIIKDDAVLAVFLTEPSFEDWRKHTAISLDEESASKHIDKVEEMAIPSDLEDKIATVRGRVNPLIDQWQRICILAERIIKRREAAAGDLARLTNTIRAVVEVNEHCWRGDECELSNGVRMGLEQVAAHCQRHTEVSEIRTRALFDTTLEALKAQRDLYVAVRDLLIRYDRLSIDQVERLKKRVESTSLKLEGVRAQQKDGWQDEVERLGALYEKDQATILAQLSRRVFIRACMWHELRTVLHNRENTLVTVLVQTFTREEQEFAESIFNNWVSLSEGVEGMPFE